MASMSRHDLVLRRKQVQGNLVTTQTGPSLADSRRSEYAGAALTFSVSLRRTPMKSILSTATGALVIALVCCFTPAVAMDDHTVLKPNDVEWGPGPASIPKGAQAAAIYGDASKEGLFALRLKLPKGYRIPPHTHSKPEVVTILSGTLRLGEGASADQSKANPLPAGSFFVMSPGMQHYVYADEQTVLQLNSNGPWGLTYVNEKDDPRKTQ
jgi:quercetin dioxygenase-like cupin family protein